MRGFLSITRRTLAGCAVVLLAAAPARAQVTTIDPGMTERQVIATLGRPLSTRSYKSFTYLFYRNGCEKKCGMNDLVTLDSGKVVDAVFRSSGRHYSGTSSSPRAIPAAEASKGNPDAPLSVPATSTPNTKKPPYVETGV
jgi:outer membrane protein assembly factor BamE (lipoprotein component of BamABCDE complex)